MASEIARSTRILPGSCVANGFRHGASAVDNALVRPVLSAARANSTAPACDTTPDPEASTDSRGYNDVDLPTRLVLRSLRYFSPQQAELSLVRAPFFMNDTVSD